MKVFSLIWLALYASKQMIMVASQQGPNFIIMQPDDLPFYDEWFPPIEADGDTGSGFPDEGLPGLTFLRENGLELKQAYTTSSACGTSRFSTMTGRYPTRSGWNRSRNQNEPTPSVVSIETVKLMDLPDYPDCSSDNMAAVLQSNGYRTGMVGKWHLSRRVGDSYQDAVDKVQECGFSFADAVYHENMQDNDDGTWHEGRSHNMEWITYEAIDFIKASDQQFLLYLNPTVPHSPNVADALELDCSLTLDPTFNLPNPPNIKGMTNDLTCEEYRQTLFDRVGCTGPDDCSNRERQTLGAYWFDDSVKAIIQALDDSDNLDNTFFLFQMDHGRIGKNTNWEIGTRVASFVHYPPFGSGTLDVPTSVIDIAATVFELAGISSHYALDGESWVDVASGDSSAEMYFRNERCLFTEYLKDRAVRCGCFKYTERDPTSTISFLGHSEADLNFFDLCDGTDSYSTSNNMELEDENLIDIEPDLAEDYSDVLECHFDRVSPTDDPDYTKCSLPDSTPQPNPTLPPVSSPFASPTASPFASDGFFQPDIIDSSNGLLDTTITMEYATFSGPFYTFTNTRLLNGLLPGPTLRLSAGDTLRILFENNLEQQPNVPSGVENEFTDPDHSNLHFHGGHVSGELPSDDIRLRVPPQSSFQYETNFPANHLPGTHWSHPHVHGSSTLQVGGGAAMTIIVRDPDGFLPSQVASAEEKLIFVQNINVDNMQEVVDEILDSKLEITHVGGPDGGPRNFRIVNGLYQQTITMQPGEWQRWRIVWANYLLNNLDAHFNSPNCEMQLLAKDGIYIQDFPRELTTATIPTAGRADIMVRCSTAGTYEFLDYQQRNMMTVSVTGNTVPSTDLNPWTPEYPAYLTDLTSTPPSNGCDCFTTIRPCLDNDDKNCINNELYDESIYMHTVAFGSVVERKIRGVTNHPYHQHVYPFQLVNGVTDLNDPDQDTYFQTGDWHDVISMDVDMGEFVTSRYVADVHDGVIMLHCHILEHEDKGTMSQELVIDGGECECDARIDAPTSSPVAMSTPTLSPVSTPTIPPVSTPTLTPLSSPTLSPVSSPTLSPVSTPTSSPCSENPSSTIVGRLSYQSTIFANCGQLAANPQYINFVCQFDPYPTALSFSPAVACPNTCGDPNASEDPFNKIMVLLSGTDVIKANCGRLSNQPSNIIDFACNLDLSIWTDYTPSIACCDTCDGF